MIGSIRNLDSQRVALLLVLLASCQTALGEGNSQTLLSFQRGTEAAPLPAAPVKVDPQVSTTALEVPAAAPPVDPRLLPPPSTSSATQAMPNTARRAPAFALPKIESLTTALAGLGIVVGLFLVCMWMLRKAGPTPTSPLPQEAVAVLGRVPLAARNFAQLLQVGNKLVLVSVTPDGVAPITEVTDPGEVQRLMGMCLRSHKHSTTAEFHSVLEKLAQEPAKGFLGNEATAAYASQKR